jgi:hypothetical protein
MQQKVYKYGACPFAFDSFSSKKLKEKKIKSNMEIEENRAN